MSNLPPGVTLQDICWDDFECREDDERDCWERRLERLEAIAEANRDD